MNAEQLRSAGQSVGAALAGFLIVGMFDSLLDVPRVAFLFYLLLVWGLALRDRTLLG